MISENFVLGNTSCVKYVRKNVATEKTVGSRKQMSLHHTFEGDATRQQTKEDVGKPRARVLARPPTPPTRHQSTTDKRSASKSHTKNSSSLQKMVNQQELQASTIKQTPPPATPRTPIIYCRPQWHRGMNRPAENPSQEETQ